MSSVVEESRQKNIEKYTMIDQLIKAFAGQQILINSQNQGTTQVAQQNFISMMKSLGIGKTLAGNLVNKS